VLILSREQVAALLDIDELVHAVAAAMVDVSAGRVSMPARVAATVVERLRCSQRCRRSCRLPAR
jgi:ornithine cyclodeaminase